MKRERHLQFEAGDTGPRNQYAALCWRGHRGGIEVLLITSRDSGRWVMPKGWPMEGFSPAASAVREAWEEAGVEGTVAEATFGFYSYDKVLPDGMHPCVVGVHPLHVSRLASRFPERGQRRRKWFPAAKAARKVAEPELRALLLRLADDPGLLISDSPTETPT